MKYSRLLFANLFRKKTRLVLTLASFTVALFLFGLLVIINGAFSGGVEVAGADRLVVINRTSIIQPIPLSYMDRILRIKGVKEVTFANWFGGIYQDERNFFPTFAIDVAHWRQMYPELSVSDAEWQKFVGDRQGAIVGEATAKKFGWKVGDHIPLIGQIFQGTWDFNIDGIYHGTRAQDDETQFWFQWDYLEERIPQISSYKNMIGWYTIRVVNPDDSVRISKAIDAEFANSPFETHTDTEKSFVTTWVKQFGNIKFLMMVVGLVVFFILLLVAANVMATTVRERVGELAVLKALGYSDRFVLLLVMTESLVIAAVGGGIGLLISKSWTVYGGDPTHGMLPLFYLPDTMMVVGFGAALAIGIASALFPAITAMRLRVVEALRRV